ncbi:hypothetical protein AC579_9551 [Pseudocercospora musae]|uniref:ABC transporter domain-containing protein n=1 Tax=Pseudocercospora musae TaxID=113226 RepID=A0A139I4P4_9PEZI|nr:hypothetical protein AC579_9551 [Pseudocercospora musae]
MRWKIPMAYSVWTTIVLEPFYLLFAANPTTLDGLLFFVGMMGSVLGGMLLPIHAYLNYRLVDDLIPLSQVKNASVLAFANFMVVYIYLGCWSFFGERLSTRIQGAYLHAVLRQETAFVDRLTTSEITTRLDADIAAIRAAVDERLGICVSMLSFLVSAYGISFWHAPALTWKMSTLLPLYFFSSISNPRRTAKLTKLVDERVFSATMLALESLLNMPIVHAFRATTRIEQLYKRRLDTAHAATAEKLFASALQSGLLYFIVYISDGFAVWQGSLEMARTAKISFGKVKLIIFCLSSVGMVLTHVAPFVESFLNAQVSYRKLAKVITRSPTINASPTAEGVHLTETESRRDFELQNVTFGYPDRRDHYALRRASCVIPGGKTTAIVGRSGSGKSTVASMLLRLYDPLDGSISFNGRDLRSYNLRSLRRHVAVVDQDPVLFSCSVFENVAYGMLDETNVSCNRKDLRNTVARVREGETWLHAIRGSTTLPCVVQRVERALRQAEAYEFVSKLEHGMATNVDAGLRLSLGQKQRLALARALIRNAPILILDEWTSALAPEMEQMLLTRVRTASAGSTIVLITHRLSATKSVDKIILLNDGSVVEQGTHKEVVERNALFAHMVSLQSAKLDVRIVTANSVQDIETATASPDVTLRTDQAEVDEIQGFYKPDTMPQTKLIHSIDPQGRPSFTVPAVVRQLYTHLQKQRLLVIVGTFGTIFVGASDTVEAAMLAGALNEINNNCYPKDHIVRNGKKYGFEFFALGLLFLIVEYVRVFTLDSLSETILAQTRPMTLRILLNQAMSWHDAKIPTSLLNYLTVDAIAFSQISSKVIGSLFGAIITFGAGPLLAFSTAWKIASILLAAIPLFVAAEIIQTRVVGHFWKEHCKASFASAMMAKESINAYRTVAAFGLEEEMLASFQAHLTHSFDAMIRKTIYANLSLAICINIPPVLQDVVRWWGLRQVRSGQYTLKQLNTVLPMLTASYESCKQLGTAMNDINKVALPAQRLADFVVQSRCHDRKRLQKLNHRDLLAFCTSSVDDRPAYDLSSIEAESIASRRAPSIQMCNVEFSYPNEPQTKVLQGVNIDVPGGAVCAIVGSSGSGKTTIFKLLETFYHPSKGQIWIDGVELGSEPDAVHHLSMALVPQNHMLFDDTIEFNLHIGLHPSITNVTHEELVQATTDANIHQQIQSLPSGYQTVLGAGGKRFSGGERQRLSIARALVRRPRLLLLDEPTSALDSIAEYRLRALLGKLRGQTTILINTNRVSMVKCADIVVLVEGGRTVDQGTFQEILKRNSKYRQSVLYQARD